MLIPNDKLTLDILFEDDDLIIINKPPHVPVHPLKEEETETIANALVHSNPSLSTIGNPLEAGLVHRLDNTTSGILVAAKKQDIWEKLRDSWNTPAIHKIYSAIIIGNIDEENYIQTPIGHHPNKKRKMMIADTDELIKKIKAREAATHYQKASSFFYNRQMYSQVFVSILTGVRHQIRVHLSSIGHPLVGDKLYQNPQKRKLDLEIAKRPMLHLFRLHMDHPRTNNPLEVCAQPSQDYNEMLKILRGK